MGWQARQNFTILEQQQKSTNPITSEELDMKRIQFILAFCLLAVPLLVARASDAPKEAEPATREAQAKLLKELPFHDLQDFEDAGRGFIGTLDDGEIKNVVGRIIYNLTEYDFIKGEEAPDTVNPSLWRQARLNMTGGLFKVTDRIYQVRALDISNMTIIESDTGLILIDPLLSRETAAAALKLYHDLAPGPGGSQRPVRAVIYSHSHTDHYGGVKGVISESEVAAGKVAVLAPDGFMEEAVSENVLAGNAMSRRAMYMYGTLLPRGEKGQVDAGLGKATSKGQMTLIAPTDIIKETGEIRTIDGVTIEFQMAPGTEAPAEMLMYFPQFKALCAAEDATHTLHNLYTLRGAQVRDANKWWKALDESIDRYADRTDVIFAQHHWPRWGKENVLAFLKQQRNAYKYLHDQTLRMANHGLTPKEISETLAFPPSLASQWHLRDYYGSVKHNVKAVYQRYLGWYDGHPADLNPLPPSEAGERYVEFMGGADTVIARAKEYYDKGEYRWVAEVLKHVVFTNPENIAARRLQADALEQLGYQAESAPWRNVYLTGARELREGVPYAPTAHSTASPDVINAMTPEMVLDYMAVRLNGPKADGKTMRINWKQPENGQVFALAVEDSVLLYKKDKPWPDADADLALSRVALTAVASGETDIDKELEAGRAFVEGNVALVREFFGLMDSFPVLFPTVTP